jgi:hypothetical protein
MFLNYVNFVPSDFLENGSKTMKNVAKSLS